jgi:hypothetical protein
MIKNCIEPVQFGYPNEFTSKNNFLMIKQELRRYEKELELKAGKGLLEEEIPDFGFQTTEIFPKKTDTVKENYDE